MAPILFTINLYLNLFVALYYMTTRSKNGFNYFVIYLVAMCIIGFFQNILGNMDLALKLNIIAISVFACVVMYKVFMLIRVNIKKPHQ